MIRLIFQTLFFFSILGCSTLVTYPEEKTAQQRLIDFPSTEQWPIKKPVTVYWHEKMIPFIEAEDDLDLAFTLGVTQAHLRLGQMELFRRISAGRISESGGPFVVPMIDRIIRTLNYQKSAELSAKMLKEDERAFLQRFVDGVNFFVKNMKDEPAEYGFLNIEPEEWTLVDAIRVGRLAASDVNWGAMFMFLQLRQEPGWEQVWKRYIEEGRRSLPSFERGEMLTFNKIMTEFTRSGSNSVAVSGEKTKTGAGIIANDPHLGIFAPNLWILAGYKSPSYHVIGYMFPGVPAVTIGRNKDIGFGGTYMRGVSTHFFEIEPKDIVSVRTEKIGRRWWFSKNIEIRESTKGPVISDGAEEEEHDVDSKLIAMTWAGHTPSNEFGAFLASNRARNWQEYRNSFKDFGVAGLNLTYADRNGNAGMMLAIKRPILKDPSEHYMLIKSKDNEVSRFEGPLDLPYVLNPQKGFVASTNNTPVQMTPAITYVTGQNDRIRRWNELLEETPKTTVEDFMKWQLDVYAPSSIEMRDFLVNKFKGSVGEEEKIHWKNFVDWDGKYEIDSRGAVVFEQLTWRLANDYFTQKIPSEKLRARILASEDWREFLKRDLKIEKDKDVTRWILAALGAVKDSIEDVPTWGDMHVQPVQSMLGMVPVVGSRFRFGEYPARGGATTISKAVFQRGYEKQKVVFGAQSRHISDMSDMDENYFVMLGGNDGWLSNPNVDNQVKMWRNGEYLKLPMRIESVRNEFTLGRLEINKSH